MNVFDRFGSRLGVVLCVAGFVLIFLGWNGAASFDNVAAQLPYLLSGGASGLGLIVLGAALIVVDSRREDQVRLEDELAALRRALDRLAPPEPELVDTGTGPKVRVGQTSYHRPGCPLLAGREEDLPELSLETATARGLQPCRQCDPRLVAAVADLARRGNGRRGAAPKRGGAKRRRPRRRTR